jgi:hypothetical protein
MLKQRTTSEFFLIKIILFSNSPIKLAELRLIAARLETELFETDCTLGLMWEACILRVAKDVW